MIYWAFLLKVRARGDVRNSATTVPEIFSRCLQIVSRGTGGPLVGVACGCADVSLLRQTPDTQFDSIAIAKSGTVGIRCSSVMELRKRDLLNISSHRRNRYTKHQSHIWFDLCFWVIYFLFVALHRSVNGRSFA